MTGQPPAWTWRSTCSAGEAAGPPWSTSPLTRDTLPPLTLSFCCRWGQAGPGGSPVLGGGPHLTSVCVCVSQLVGRDPLRFRRPRPQRQPVGPAAAGPGPRQGAGEGIGHRAQWDSQGGGCSRYPLSSCLGCPPWGAAGGSWSGFGSVGGLGLSLAGLGLVFGLPRQQGVLRLMGQHCEAVGPGS